MHCQKHRKHLDGLVVHLEDNNALTRMSDLVNLIEQRACEH